jgi:hypothetical protein
MRFYLNFPLVAGFTLMATVACLGMLQFVAARGGFAGLSLFVSGRKTGMLTGLGLTFASLMLYVAFAPEILTPGPAGTEVAEMFGICALISLGITLVGAHLRLRDRALVKNAGRVAEVYAFNGVDATLFRHPAQRQDPMTEPQEPTVVLVSDPMRLVTLPDRFVASLLETGFQVWSVEGAAFSGAYNDGIVQLSNLLQALYAEHGCRKNKTGLVALGTAGDIALGIDDDAPISVVIAVAPLSLRDTKGSSAHRGLDWLHELSCIQTWQWRRRWRSKVDAVAPSGQELAVSGDGPTLRSALVGAHPIMATRSKKGLELLPVSSWRHFTLLEDDQVQHKLVSTLRRRLVGISFD